MWMIKERDKKMEESNRTRSVNAEEGSSTCNDGDKDNVGDDGLCDVMKRVDERLKEAVMVKSRRREDLIARVGEEVREIDNAWVEKRDDRAHVKDEGLGGDLSSAIKRRGGNDLRVALINER